MEEKIIEEVVENLENKIQENQKLENEEIEIDETAENQQLQNYKEKQNTEFGKFKNPSELLRAYNQLEKEFTKRSQKLKEIESQLEKTDQVFQSDEKVWKETVDKFFEETPSAKPFAKEMAKEILCHPQLKDDKNCLVNALTRVLVDKFKTPEQLLSDGQFLNDYVLNSETIKNAVIKSYLQGIKQGLPPVTLKNDGQAGVAEKTTPKSISEAGLLFLKNNR